MQKQEQSKSQTLKHIVDGKVLSVSFKKCESSNISGYYFLEEKGKPTGTLYIYFTNNKYYRYDNVPHGVYQGMLTAPSVGKYFFSNIRDKYTTTMVKLTLAKS